MASFKKPCRHCGTLLESDARFCPHCASGAPFADLCPACLREVSRAERICPGCGRPLYVTCPHCGAATFVAERCQACGRTLMVRCENPRCGGKQFFENTKCTMCGKKIKKAIFV